jgi:hypothetical protein
MSDLLPPDDEAVSLAAGHDGVIRFGSCERPYADDPYPFLDYAVEIRGGGVQANALVRSLAGDDLPGFLRHLAADFRGWPEARHWRSLEDQLRIEATHDGLGHVTLLVRLRRRPYADDWDLAIPVSVEAGAEMAALADRFDMYFRDVPV